MKTLKDGKAATLTIKISQKTRERAMALYKKIDSNMSFGSFLGEMVIKGLAFEEIWREKERVENVYDIMIHVEPAGNLENEGYGLSEENLKK
jgi:hypothetical protein